MATVHQIPTLLPPEGWRLIERANGFAEAVDADRNRYYLAPTENPVPLNRPEPSPEVYLRVRTISDDYIASAWPNGCPATVAIEIRLAIYAGMYSAFEQFQLIGDTHAEDDEAAAAELEEVRLAVIDRALTLNRERTLT